MGLIVTNPDISLQANNGSPRIYYFADGAALFGCIGSPEGVITANARSLAISETGTVYVKTTNGVATGWSALGGGGGTISGSIALNQVAVGSAANTIGGSSALTFASGVLGITGASNPGMTITGSAATQSGLTVNQSVTGAAASAFLSFATSSDQTLFRLTSDTFTPSGLVKARQIDFLGATGIVEFLLRLDDSSSRFVFGINNGEAMAVSSSTTENLVLGSSSTGAVPRNAQIKFYNATNAFYTQIRATAFAANRIWDLPLGSPTGTQALVGSLSGSTITLDWGSVSAALTATQIGFGSAGNVLTGSADLTYNDATGVVDLSKSGINNSVRFTVNNTNVGNAAQARFGVSANVSGAALIAYSSVFTTSGLRTANSAVLDLDGAPGVILGQGSSYLAFGLGTTEYARLTTARLGCLAFGMGSALGSLDVLLEREAANELALRNGTNAQTFRVYNTYTNASNYERLSIGWSGNILDVTHQKSGTGSDRSIRLSAQQIIFRNTGGTEFWVFNSSGHLVTGTDNTYDIGASGATRPRTIYFATSLIGTLWNLGGTTSSFPAIARSGASIVFQLADGTLQTAILPVNTNQLQFGGADAASPGAIALRVQNVVGGTSNTSGQNLSIYGCAGTGDQPGGQIILRVAPAGSSGTTQNATIVGLAVTGPGQVYGAALHNNSAGMSGATNQYIGSGTYSPTITAVANCSVTTPGVNFKYLRVGNIVHVTGQLSVDPTAASTLTRARIALPIASDLTGSVGCQGVGACADVFGLCGAVYPDTTNDAAELNFIADGTAANNVWCVSFSYEVS